jgi:hypothetical protein
VSEKPKEIIVIDVREALKQGVAVRTANDTLIGNPNVEGPKADNRKPWERWPRKVKLYDKDAPSYDGRLQLTFLTGETCGIEDVKTKDKCKLKLVATRAVNSKFEWDDNHTGGQLKYDFADYRYYLFCYRHGPFSAGPPSW